MKCVLAGLGRDGPWQGPNGPGNPVVSELLRRWYRGYTQLLFHEGYRESRAVPLTRERLEAVVDQLLEEIDQEALCSVQRALLLRDLCCVLYLWAGAQRGHECGELQVTDFYLEGTDAQPAWGVMVAGRIPVGGRVIVEPSQGTKSRQHGRLGEIEIRREPEAREAYCFLRWVPEYASAMQACGSALVEWVFKPLQEPEHKVFREGALSSQAMNAAYQRHVHACQFFMGESLHGIRRGVFQHQRFVEGRSVQDIMDVALLTNASSLTRYLHRTAHAPRVREAEARRRTAGPGSGAEGGGAASSAAP